MVAAPSSSWRAELSSKVWVGGSEEANRPLPGHVSRALVGGRGGGEGGEGGGGGVRGSCEVVATSCDSVEGAEDDGVGGEVLR